MNRNCFCPNCNLETRHGVGSFAEYISQLGDAFDVPKSEKIMGAIFSSIADLGLKTLPLARPVMEATGYRLVKCSHCGLTREQHYRNGEWQG